ncbi:MAG TPA: nitrate reductase molybdenum cofactor assembly chaperone [Burkholderiales bacterium]|nr:nitrate reductase molybdenum cofactor assembly chaperone [Burkholderiales bacterium]
MITFRALGALLAYPDRDLVVALPEIAGAIGQSRLLGRAEKERLAALIAELRRADPYELEERYVALFDRGRATSLHLFEHVHGDSRERGQAMVDLGRTYERAGLHLTASELPDYLPAVLEFLSCQPMAGAREMLADCAHILRVVGERLAGRGSRYAAVFDAILGAAGQAGLDWSKAPQPEQEPAVDDDWMDAPAFGAGSERDSGGRPAIAVMQFMPRKPK